MATLTLTRPGIRALPAYLGLAKPRGILPHLITAAAAMFLAAGGLPPAATLGYTLLGGGLTAAAANTFNSFFDRDIDRLMQRTRRRPLPSGQVKPARALAFGLITGFLGIMVLSTLVNWAAAFLAMFALAYYVLPYTVWLKRRSYWGAIIGSGIGAVPPLIGWVALRPVTPVPLLLAAIIVLWTIPHFWSLALFRREDYRRAGIAVLPARGAAGWIVACACLLAALSLYLVAAAGLGAFYLADAGVLDAVLLFLALRLVRRDFSKAGRLLYRFSIVYIAALFSGMIIDRIIFR